ncbi:MAG: hypothetical protein IIV06_05865, partial [Alistipes sp.]|nr:hypothetical protein [Alistipes sp.]
IYNSNPNRWSPSNPKLYDLTLYIKLSGILREYIPLKVGFVDYGYNEAGEITAFGKPLTLKKERYNAAKDKATTEREIKALKQRGINCLMPEYPQPDWYYDICDRVGIYVIDCAAISAPQKRTDRTVGGTPSNDPKMVDEYIERVKAMYYRSRNFTCVVAFSLGNPSGNGYAMQKAYEWLKGVEKFRPVIYEDAAGEWNSDL